MSEFMPPWWSRYVRPSGSVPDQQMRVSDAERSQVADVLSKHYSDGRLDEAEFNERLQRAMAAKTRADLSGLMFDLPPLAPAVPSEAEVHRRRRGLGHFALAFLLFFVFVSAFSWVFWPWHFPWLLFALVVFLLWRRASWGRHPHRHEPGVRR